MIRAVDTDVVILTITAYFIINKRNVIGLKELCMKSELPSEVESILGISHAMS